MKYPLGQSRSLLKKQKNCLTEVEEGDLVPDIGKISENKILIVN